MKKFLLVTFSVIIIFYSGCETTVIRVSPNSQIELSGYWNDQDVKIVCEALVKDCLASPRVNQAIRSFSRTPVVVVGRFRNESSEHIDTGIIVSVMEKAIFDSGRLNFVAGSNVRDEIRAERDAQQEHATPQTMARLGSEVGADFFMTGTVRSIIDREGNNSIRSYFVTAELTNIETNERIWMGQNNEIKKIVIRPSNRF